MDSLARQGPDTRVALGILLLAFAAFALHFPGQATYDTLAQAYDGATGVYTSNQPPAMSLLLSSLSLPGVLALQITLFAAAVWRVLALSGSTKLIQCAMAFTLFLFPVLLLYVGIVWKDVLFAHGAILAVLLLPASAPSKHLIMLAISAAILAIAVAVRQQAMLVALVAVLYLISLDWRSGLNQKSRWLGTCLWIAVFSLCSLGTKTVVQARGEAAGALAYEGPIRQLAMFDLGGILTRAPDIEFAAIEARAHTVPQEHRPTRDRVLEQLGRYSPERQDYMVEPDNEPHLWIRPEAWHADWRTNVRRHPLAYLEHRLDATSWLLGFHAPEKCVPFAVGIFPGPSHMLEQLGAAPGLGDRAEALGRLGMSSIFLFRPWMYIALSLATTAYLLAKGGRHHAPVIALQLCGLLYAASYLLIGFACDFRYTYFTTASALLGAAYAIGVMFPSRQGRSPAANPLDSVIG